MDVRRATIHEIRVEFNKEELAHILDQYLLDHSGKDPSVKLPGSPYIFVEIDGQTVTMVQQHHVREK